MQRKQNIYIYIIYREELPSLLRNRARGREGGHEREARNFFEREQPKPISSYIIIPTQTKIRERNFLNIFRCIGPVLAVGAFAPPL